MEGQPNRQVRISPVSVQLGPAFLIRAFQDHPLVGVGLTAFCPLAGGLPRLETACETIENSTRAGFEPNMIVRTVYDHGFTIDKARLPLSIVNPVEVRPNA